MTRSRARWLAAGFIGLYFLLAFSGMGFQILSQTFFLGGSFPLPVWIAFYMIVGMWVATGGLVATRRPHHPVGWIICIGLISAAVDQAATAYAGLALSGMTTLLPGLPVALVWLNLMGMPFGILVFILVFLLTPHGRFRSYRWRRLGWLAVAVFLIYIFTKMVEPGPVTLMPSQTNPMGTDPSTWAILEPVMWLALITLVGVCYLGAFGSMVLWARQGNREERQQVKWFLTPAALFALGIPILVYGDQAGNWPVFQLGGLVHVVAVCGVVVAVAVSIFKYRLYDIDILINRTLVYGLLTGSLALVYFASVALLSQVFSNDSQLTIVLSTLTIAALFSPLRRRIQTLIDRRFYRRRYNAERTLAAFSTAVREQVDLEKLSRSLVSVVEETVQPETTSLWLRVPDEGSR